MNELTDPDFTLCKDVSIANRCVLEHELSKVDKVIVVTKNLVEELFIDHEIVQSFTHNDITMLRLYMTPNAAYCVICEYSFPGFICSTVCSVIEATQCTQVEVYSASIVSSIDPIYVGKELINEKSENFVFCWSNSHINNSISSGNLPYVAAIGPLLYSTYPELTVKVFCEIFNENPSILSKELQKFI